MINIIYTRNQHFSSQPVGHTHKFIITRHSKLHALTKNILFPYQEHLSRHQQTNSHIHY